MKLGLRRRGMAVAAAVVITAATVSTAMTRDNDEVTVIAMFTDASPIVAGNEVKASGVTVGAVDSVSLDGGLARVEMTVARSVLPLYEDARAVITLKDLLGERYVNLERGTEGRQRTDDVLVLTREQTERGVDLQDILNEVDQPTGTALAALVTTLGEGVNAQGQQVAAGIAALAPAMRQADLLAEILSEHNGLLGELVDNVEPVVGALADGRGKSMDRLVASTEQTLSAVAAEREAVEATLRQLPGTMRKAQRTLAEVAGVARESTPTLAAIRPVTGNLHAIAGELHAFADAADPALASLPAVLERAEELLDEAQPLVGELRPAGADVRAVAGHGRDLMENAVSKRLDNLMEFVKGWALSTSGRDGISHYFRASIMTTPDALGTTGDGALPGGLDVPQESDDQTESPTLDPDQKELPLVDDVGPGVTGLTQEQEQSLLGQLLGGR